MKMLARAISVLVFLLAISPLSWATWVNDKAPDFSLPDISGKPVSLESLKGKVILIDFWASWCGPCKKEFPELNKFAEKYKDSALVIIAINIDKKRANADEFLLKNPPHPQKMLVLFDPESKVVSSYAARAMPTSFIIDKEGIIRYVHLGFNESDPERWITEVDSLLK